MIAGWWGGSGGSEGGGLSSSSELQLVNNIFFVRQMCTIQHVPTLYNHQKLLIFIYKCFLLLKYLGYLHHHTLYTCFIYIYRLNRKNKKKIIIIMMIIIIIIILIIKLPFSTIEILENPIPEPEMACDFLFYFFLSLSKFFFFSFSLSLFCFLFYNNEIHWT